MSLKHMDTSQAAFHEASAYFSEEEWNLLQEWQKELCKNVMKEIHQALISLGSIIATTVCSVRAKETGQMSPMDNQYYSKSDPTTDLLLKIDNQKPLHLISDQDSGDAEGNDYPRADHCPTGFPFLNTDVLLNQKEEPIPICIDHLGAEIGESNMDPILGHNVISLQIKEEDDSDSMNEQECMRMEINSSPARIRRRRMTSEGRVSVSNSMKHPRRPKFSDEELTALAEGTVRYSRQLFGDLKEVTALSKRTELWGRVTYKINAVSKYRRSVPEVKKRWQDLKARVRLLTARQRQYKMGSFGDAGKEPQLAPWEEKASRAIDKAIVRTKGVAEAGIGTLLARPRLTQNIHGSLPDTEEQQGIQPSQASMESEIGVEGTSGMQVMNV